MSTEDIDGLDDVENSLLHYNQAIIHYHMRQYSEAIFIGERLYQFLEPFGTLSSLHEFELLLQTDFRNNPGVSSYERLVSCDSVEFEYDVMSLGFFLFVFPPRREVCSGCLLSAGGSLPAHLPTGESPSPSSCTGQAVSARKQQEQQRRGTTRSLRRVYVLKAALFTYA